MALKNVRLILLLGVLICVIAGTVSLFIDKEKLVVFFSDIFMTKYAPVPLDPEVEKSEGRIKALIDQWIIYHNNKLPALLKQCVPGLSSDFASAVNLDSKPVLVDGLKKYDIEVSGMVKAREIAIKKFPFFLVDYKSKNDEEETVLYSLKSGKGQAIVTGGLGNDSIGFYNLGKDIPLVIQALSFGGGSGVGYKYFVLADNLKEKLVLEVGIWNNGDVYFKDIDRDGNAEVIVTSRSSYPEDISKLLNKEPTWDFVGPMLRSVRFYKWNKDAFKEIGVHYSLMKNGQ